MEKTIATLGLLSALQSQPASAQDAQTAPIKVVFQSEQEAREATLVRTSTADEAKARQQAICSVFDNTIRLLDRTLRLEDGGITCTIKENVDSHGTHPEPQINLSLHGSSGQLVLKSEGGHIFVTATLPDQSVLSFTDPVSPEDLNGLPQEWKR